MLEFIRLCLNVCNGLQLQVLISYLFNRKLIGTYFDPFWQAVKYSVACGSLLWGLHYFYWQIWAWQRWQCHFFLFFLHTGQDTFVLQIENLYGAHVDKPMWDPQQFCLFESLWGFSVGNPTIVGWVKTHIGAPKSKTAVGPVSLPCPACLLAHCL